MENKKIDKMKLMKLITMQYPLDKDNYEAFDEINLKFGEHQITITEEDMKNYFEGVKNES